jgi:hypothetical protein
MYNNNRCKAPKTKSKIQGGIFMPNYICWKCGKNCKTEEIIQKDIEIITQV